MLIFHNRGKLKAAKDYLKEKFSRKYPDGMPWNAILPNEDLTQLNEYTENGKKYTDIIRYSR